MTPELDAFRRACELAGGPLALAEKLNMKHPTVYQWNAGTRAVSIHRAQEIEALTGVWAEDMCAELKEMLERQKKLWSRRAA